MIWKTKLAEPYPREFCDEMASQMTMHPRLSGAGLTPERGDDIPPPPVPTSAVGQMLQRPPKSHYLTHFPKHPGWETCNLAKAMKKHGAVLAANIDKLQKTNERKQQLLQDESPH